MRRARRRWPILDHTLRAEVRYSEVLGGRLAAAIAYYGFFACFALALLAYSLLGFLLEYDREVFAAVESFLRQNLPWLEPSAIAGTRGRSGVLGLVGLMLTGIGWIEAIRSSQRLIHGVTQQPGHPVLRWLTDLLILVALLLLIGSSLTVIYALEWAIEAVVGGPSTLLSVVGWVFAVGLNLVLALALVGGVPRLRLSRWRLWPSAIFVAVGITALNTLGQLVVGYVRSNPAYTVVTGAVGLLLYLYLFNQLLLFGAALAATARSGRVHDLAGGDPEHVTPPSAGR
ncbi:hypothetical protein GCM10010201_23380 [Pilimelia columellifera subsp. columellifera]|uniref:Uncharacterized protein n=1 Tax=Pilimelia columellifera subsp. columellifera TaxID=706583 RepID=A0ABP6AUV9_9ACTN